MRSGWATIRKPDFLLSNFFWFRLLVLTANGLLRDTRIIKVALAEQSDRLNV